VEAVRPYLEGIAKNLADKLYGPKGPLWGTKLTQIENLLLELREVGVRSAAVTCHTKRQVHGQTGPG